MAFLRTSSFLLPLPLVVLWLLMLAGGGIESALDESVYSALYGGTYPIIVGAARFFTALGGWEVLVPASLAAAAYLYLRQRRRDAFLLLALTLGGRLAVAVQKELTGRERPILSDHLVTTTTLSFPSGHAANGLIVWLSLALFLPPGRRPAWIVAALILAFLIGLSRVMLGVHWPSDVIGGWSFALAWTLGIVALARDKNSSRG